MSKILAHSIVSMGRLHNNACINASSVSSFYWLLRSFFTQFCLEKSTFTYSCGCHAEVAVGVELKLHNWNCRSYWNLKVSARVPRLDSSYVSICKLQPLYFVTCSFWKAFTMKGGKFAKHIFVKYPKYNIIFDAHNVFDRCWRLSILNNGWEGGRLLGVIS